MADQSLVDLIVADYVEKANAANRTAEQIALNTVDSGKLLNEIRDDRSTQDPKLQKFHKWLDDMNERIAKAYDDIEAHVRENLMPKPDENVNVDTLKDQHKEQKSAAQRALNFLRDQIPADTNLEEFLKSKGAPELRNLRGGAATTAPGSSGISRPRIVGGYINGEEVTKDGKVNFTMLAQKLSSLSNSEVSVRDLQTHAFEAAGTTDLKTLKGRAFEFVYNTGPEGEQKNYTVRIVPKGDE